MADAGASEVVPCNEDAEKRDSGLGYLWYCAGWVFIFFPPLMIVWWLGIIFWHYRRSPEERARLKTEHSVARCCVLTLACIAGFLVIGGIISLVARLMGWGPTSYWMRRVSNATEFGDDRYRCVCCESDDTACVDRWSAMANVSNEDLRDCDLFC